MIGFVLVLVAAFPVQAQPLEAAACNCMLNDSATGNLVAYCGRNQYLLGPDDPPTSSRNTGGAAVPLRGCCCPMPSNDILTDTHFYGVTEECPPDSVVTGGTTTYCSRNCLMRCTRINTERYMLGPVRKGVYWRRKGFVLMGGWGAADVIYWDDIPEAVRLAHGRGAKDLWDGDGCAADPIGGLLVAKRGTHCDMLEFRELRTREGVPVKMFPDCISAVDKYAVNPTCMTK